MTELVVESNAHAIKLRRWLNLPKKFTLMGTTYVEQTLNRTGEYETCRLKYLPFGLYHAIYTSIKDYECALKAGLSRVTLALTRPYLGSLGYPSGS